MLSGYLRSHSVHPQGAHSSEETKAASSKRLWEAGTNIGAHVKLRLTPSCARDRSLGQRRCSHSQDSGWSRIHRSSVAFIAAVSAYTSAVRSPEWGNHWGFTDHPEPRWPEADEMDWDDRPGQNPRNARILQISRQSGNGRTRHSSDYSGLRASATNGAPWQGVGNQCFPTFQIEVRSCEKSRIILHENPCWFDPLY